MRIPSWTRVSSPANEAAWEDLQDIFGTTDGDTASVSGSRVRSWIWRGSTHHERKMALWSQTATASGR